MKWKNWLVLPNKIVKEKTAADVKEYTSKFESMADASNKQEDVVSKPKKEKVEEEKESR